jgi:Uma2 family endonuclease
MTIRARLVRRSGATEEGRVCDETMSSGERSDCRIGSESGLAWIGSTYRPGDVDGTPGARVRSAADMKYAERLRTRRWTRVEYDRLIDRGLLDEDEPIELLDGLLVVKEPQNTPHVTAVTLVADALRAAFGPGWVVRVQGPIALDDRSEPEPDVCVVAGTARDYRDAHPTRPALVVEVAHSGLRIAHGRKAQAYARAGIADYWIVNLVDHVVEVHRQPFRRTTTRPRSGYASIETLRAEDVITPLAAPAARVRVTDLLP